jgi:hypothetical protein
MPAKTTKPGPDRTYVDAGKTWETDQIGKRKVDPSVKRQIKAANGKLPDSIGQPEVHGDSEAETFKKAHDRIAELRDSKEFDKDF